jgi:CheY-like chemotaxis protein
MDIHLPGVNGMEILRDLKEHLMTKNIPIIMIAGSDEYGLFGKSTA